MRVAGSVDSRGRWSVWPDPVAGSTLRRSSWGEEGAAKAAPISIAKPCTDHPFSSGKAISLGRRSSHERQRRDNANAKAEVRTEVAPGTPLEDVRPKQVILAGDCREMSAKSKKGSQGRASRASESSEKHSGDAKRRQNRGDGRESTPVDSARPLKWRRSESGVVLAGPPTPPSPLDRWDGSLMQVEAAVEPLPSFEFGKRTPDFLDATIRHSEGYVKEKESHGDMKSCKRKSRAVLTTKSRLISTVDVPNSLMQINGAVSAASIHAKNKVSHKKDIEVTASEQEKGQIENVTAEVGLPQVSEHNANLGISTSKKSGSRQLREEEFQTDQKEMSLQPSVHYVENKERGKRKEKGMESRGSKRSKYEKEGLLDLQLFVKRKSQDSNKHPRSSEDKELRTSEWKIQEELRNLELEKELENRIRQRKEESSERGRWKDDDKERESRYHFDHREDRIIDQNHRDDRSRRERHVDRPENKDCRKESRFFEEQSREVKYHESGRGRKLYENEPIGHKKDKLEKLSAANFDLDHHHANDRRVRRSKDSVIDTVHEGRSKSCKEGMHAREWIPLEQSNCQSKYAGESDHEQKRAQKSLSVDNRTKEGNRSREKVQEKDHQVNHEENDVLLYDKAQSQNRNARDVEESCEPVRDNHREQRGRNMSEKRPKHQSTDIIRSPSHEVQASPSTKVDDSSPVPDDRLYTYKKSQSPAIFDGNRPLSRIKSASGELLELTYSMSSSSATKHHQDNGSQLRDHGEHHRHHSEAEEVKSEDLVCSQKVVRDETRNRSLSPRRSQDLYLSLPPFGPRFSRQEPFSRTSTGRRAMEMKMVSGHEEAISRDQESWRETFPSGMARFDNRASDELFSRERPERVRGGPPGNRSMLRSQSLSFTSLPPPPPFRHGIDNPSILGPLDNAREEGSSSRDLGRLERKPSVRRMDAAGTLGRADAWRGAAFGNWNPRSHGPGPGNAFSPFQPHHYGAHPPTLFSGVGRQYSGPPLFGPGRAHMDMNYGGGRFMGPGNRLGGEAFHAQGRGPGWHCPLGEDIRPPVFVPFEGWEGYRPSSDVVQHEWDCTVGSSGGMPWEQDQDIWESRQMDGNMDFPQHAPHQAPASGRGAPSGMPLAMKVCEDKVVYTSGGEQEEECEVSSSKLASNDTVIAKPSKDDKFRKKSLATMKGILSKLDISAKLAGSELYSQYRSFVSESMPAAKPIIGIREYFQEIALSDEDCVMEADLEAEALLSQLQVPENRLLPLPEGAFEAALSNYKKPEEELRVFKSTIGSFVLSFGPKAISTQHLITRQVNQQSATVQADNATFAAISDMRAGTVDAINSIEVDKATEMATFPKFKHCCDVLLRGGGPTSSDVTDHSGREAFNVEIEGKFNEDGSIGGGEVLDLVKSTVECEEEQTGVDLYREPTVLGTIIVEEAEMQIDMGSHSFEHPLTSVSQFDSGGSLCLPLDERVTLVQRSYVGEVLQIRSPTSKENDENIIDGLVVCDSNSESKQLVIHQLIGDKQVVIDSEDVCSKSSKDFAEAEMCMEKGVRELACFMFFPKRNRIYYAYEQTFQLKTWSHRRL